jgi:hypothetical protein
MKDQGILTKGEGSVRKEGRISKFDLLILTSSDQLLFILKPNFSLFTKQPSLAVNLSNILRRDGGSSPLGRSINSTY